MKFKLILLLMLFVLFVSTNAQDKIITVKNDTIDCSILEINPKLLIFEIDSKGIKTKGDINRTEISGYFLSANSKATFESGKSKSKNKQKGVPIKTYKAFQFGLSGGYGYLLGNTSAAQNLLVVKGYELAEVRNYYNDFRNGLLIDASAHYLFYNGNSGSVGWGLTHSFMTSKQSISGYVYEGIEQDWVYEWQFGVYEEQYYINFTGISIYAKKKAGIVNFYLEDAVGIAFYRNELTYLSYPMLLTSVSMGTKSKLGIEVPINQKLLIDFNASFFYSQLSWVKRNNGYNSQIIQLQVGNYESLSRIELGLGLKYFLSKKAKQ